MRGPVSDLPIFLENVTISTGETRLLDDVSVSLAGGNTTCLVGPNGAGKTTLLRAAMGLMPATHGRITWGGREAAAPDKRAIMFQRPVMLRRSVIENLFYALQAANAPRATRQDRATIC